MAQVVVPLLAGRAQTAGNRRFGADPVADLEFGYIRTNGHHFGTGLVSEDYGFVEKEVPNLSVFPVVDV